MMIEVKTNTGTKENAMLIANLVVDERYAAAVNIIDVQSVYRYKGEVNICTEYQLIIKSIQGNFNAIMSIIKANHLYELPAVYATAVTKISDEYEAWIVENSTARAAKLHDKNA